MAYLAAQHDRRTVKTNTQRGSAVDGGSEPEGPFRRGPSPVRTWDAGRVRSLCARRANADEREPRAAIDLLRTIDAQLAATLARLLARKQQAAYESRDISARDAATCIRQATTLVEAARRRNLTT